METIIDSGERRTFQDGAVRDITEGKGRFDLVPLQVTAAILDDYVFGYIGEYEASGNDGFLYDAIKAAMTKITDDSGECENKDDDKYRIMLGVAKHFEAGAKKYEVDNWKKGIPVSSFIDSALRHWCKYRAEWKDEDHASACIWNLLCCIWTIHNKPEYIDFPRRNAVSH